MKKALIAYSRSLQVRQKISRTMKLRCASKIGKVAKKCRFCRRSFIPKVNNSATCKKCMTARPYCACRCGLRVTAIGKRGRRKIPKFCVGHSVRTPEIKARMRKTLKQGRLSGRIGIYSTYVKGYHYKNTWFRSIWEVAFVIWLDANKQVWQYEPTRFDLGCAGVYVPDFYLPALDCYVEIKGVVRDVRFGDKLRKFVTQRKGNLVVLLHKDLIRLGVLAK